VSLGKGVTHIEFGTFSGCESLTSVTFSDTLNCIGGSSFNGCKELKSMTIPASVSSIEGYAFAGCSGLSHVCYLGKRDPASEVVSTAFSGCTSLAEVNVIENNYEDEVFCGKQVSKGDTCEKKSSSFEDPSSSSRSPSSTEYSSGSSGEKPNFSGAKLDSKPNEFVMFIMSFSVLVGLSIHL